MLKSLIGQSKHIIHLWGGNPTIGILTDTVKKHIRLNCCATNILKTKLKNMLVATMILSLKDIIIKVNDLFLHTTIKYTLVFLDKINKIRVYCNYFQSLPKTYNDLTTLTVMEILRSPTSFCCDVVIDFSLQHFYDSLTFDHLHI